MRREHFGGIRVGPDRRRAAIVRARHRQRRPDVEGHACRGLSQAVVEHRRQRQCRHHPRMAAFAHRILGWRRVIGSRLRNEDELLFVGIELQEQRASRARRRQDVREQERRCRGKIGRLGERGQQREMSSFSLRRGESRRARQLDGHSDGCWLLAAGCWLPVAGCWSLARGATDNWQLTAASSQSSVTGNQ